MKDIVDAVWGLTVAAVLGTIGMFYRHGYVLAGLQQRVTDQAASQKKLWDKLDAMDEKLTDIQIKVGRGKRNGRR